MKYIALVLALLVFFTSGCTSLNPIELAPEQLREKVLTDNIIHVGDKVNIVTSDGIRHVFKVTLITEDQIIGEDNSVPIIDIIALEIRSVSGVKTAVLLLVVIPILIGLATGATIGL